MAARLREAWDFEVADAPDFERYGERFDPESGSGEVEIWVPIN